MPLAKLMVVEDEGIIAMDIKAHLEGFDYQVLEVCYAGEQAVKRALELKPDLILMDIMLRGNMDGITAAKHIYQRFHIPIVFLTAHGDQATLNRARAMGPYGYLTKPFRPDELRAAVEVALFKYGMEKQLRESAAYLSQVLKLINNGVVIIDREQRVKLVNAFAERILDCPAQDLIGNAFESCFTLLDTTTQSVVAQPIKKIFDQAVTLRIDYPIALKGPSGTEIMVEGSISPIMIDGTEIIGAALIFQGLSKRTTEQLLK